MYEIYERYTENLVGEPDASIFLTHEQRTKARLKTVAKDGIEVRIFLEHGKALQVGEYLRSVCGRVIRVDAAKEPVAKASCEDWHSFSRACYHLGNRHVKVQLSDRILLMTPDHVLEAMLKGLGLTVVHENAVFIPEHGAYHAGADHSHGLKQSHSHQHGYKHEHH